MNKEKLISALKVPPEQGNLPHFELNGASQFLADGCLGILHYDETKVSLNCGSLIAEICGKELTVHHLGESEAEVRGSICSVKLV